MTKEEKILLIVDLCARIPYGVKAKSNESGKVFTVMRGGEYEDGEIYFIGTRIGLALKVDEFKMYLRRMESMDKHEKEEYQYITERWMYDANHSISDSIDWLNERHFDYRGLIEKGLAIEAPDAAYTDTERKVGE